MSKLYLTNASVKTVGLVRLEIVNLKFKRDHPDWSGGIEIDLFDPGSFVVLVGKNAGGKSLALKAIEKYTNLLRDPGLQKKKDFEKLANAAGISEIHATYRGNITNMRYVESEFISINDLRTAKSLIEKGEKGIISLQEENIGWCELNNWEIAIESKFTRSVSRSGDVKMKYKRRLGDIVELFWGVEDTPDVPNGKSVLVPTETTKYGRWYEIFDKELEIDRMFHYGNEGWFPKELGISIPNFFEDNLFWDRDKSWHFIPATAQMLLVDEAYDVTQETIDKLDPFKPYSKLTRKTKEWINGKLSDAFDHAGDQAKMETKLSLEDENTKENEGTEDEGSEEETQNQQFKDIATKVTHFKLVYPTAKLFNDALEDDFVTHLKTFNFTPQHMFRVSRALNLEYDDKRFSKLYLDFKPPTWTTIFGPGMFRGGTDHGKPENVSQLYSNLALHCIDMIREYDSNWWFWIVVSDFLDFPEYSSSTYYSSGQKRLIAILETVVGADPSTVLLVDEPELSLHIDWQRKFITKISEFSGNKLILATHSPDIIYDHVENVIEVPPGKEV